MLHVLIYSFTYQLKKNVKISCISCKYTTSIYKNRDPMLEGMGLYYVAHFMKFYLLRLLNQQSLHLYQSISLLN